MKKIFTLMLLLTSLALSAQEVTHAQAMVTAYGQAGNVAYSFGQQFYKQIKSPTDWEVAAGVQQAQFLHEVIDTAICQNDVKPVYGFDFHSVDEFGNLIPAGTYDSAHYVPSYLNYDSLTEITLTVWPIYEGYDTLYLSYQQMLDNGFSEPGRADRLLETVNDCDSLMHYMVYVCGFPETDVQDGDGNGYANLWLGHDCWMGENMHTTHYVGGEEAPNMVYKSDMFPNIDANLSTYGRLYTWQSAVGLPAGSTDAPLRDKDANHFVQGICPIGWHIPTQENVNTLGDFPAPWLISDSLWLTPGTNQTGFDARPAGMYNPNTGRYENLLGFTYYWNDEMENSALAKDAVLSNGCDDTLMQSQLKQYGMSVRCVKDNIYSNTSWTQELRKEPMNN